MRNAAILTAGLLCVLSTGMPVQASTWTVPGTVNAGGLNNTRFVSDLAVTNPGSVAVQATISFVPANGTTSRQITLTAGQTVVYRNALDSLWGIQGAGATQVASDSPLLIRARTYNTAAAGTYGVALPVFADERMLSTGTSAESLWISQAGDGSSGYRTNIAVVFPDPTGGEARVTVYDADGNEAGSQSFSLGTAGFQQFGVGSFAGSVAIARAEIQVIRGTCRRVFRRRRQRHGRQLALHLRRSARRLAGRPRQRCGPGERPEQHLLPHRRPVLQPDLRRRERDRCLSQQPERQPGPFDAHVHRSRREDSRRRGRARFSPRPSGGLCRRAALHVRGARGDFVPDEQRGSSGVKPGTFGAQQKPRQIMSFLMSADAGAVVTGIRQNALFRTNVGFAAGPDGADYALTLKNASGATSPRRPALSEPSAGRSPTSRTCSRPPRFPTTRRWR